MGSQKIRFVVERILTQKRLQQGRGVVEKIVLPDQGLISTEGGLGGGGGKAGLLEWLLPVKIMLLEREGHRHCRYQHKKYWQQGVLLAVFFDSHGV